MPDYLPILLLSIVGLLAHLSQKRPWLQWVLYSVMVIMAIAEGFFTINSAKSSTPSWAVYLLAFTCISTLLILFKSVRRLASFLLPGFIADSIPHLIALFIYITAATYLLISCWANNSGLLPVISQSLFYTGFGLLLLSFCGVGIYVARPLKAVLARLALSKPSKKQIAIGIILIFVSFAYDLFWAQYTHRLTNQDLATQLSYYHPNTFTLAGRFIPSVILAMATTLFAAIGEETLIRGALQPVFGILPSSILHAIYHGQFTDAPIFMFKVALWSILMGLVKRYTNTTTTIIAHAGFNLMTMLLFALNP